MKKHLKFLLVAAIFSLMLSCTRDKNVEIIVMHTSDIHGAFFPYDFISSLPMDRSLSHVYSVVQRERRLNKNLILLDNGDILQGQPAAYYYNFIDTSSVHLAAQIINFMNYDAAGAGNHDIETGHAVYDKVFAEYNCPVIAANAVRTSDGKPYFEPYAMIEREGVKIAVLGLITPGIPKWLPNSIWEGIEFRDMVETAEYWIKEIRKKENPHIILGLFHSGYDFEREGEDINTPNNENASMLVAQKVPGFDAILIGHDHDKFCGKVCNAAGDSVLIVDPQNEGKLVSKVQISLKLKDGKVIKKTVSGSLIETKNFEPDSSFITNFKSNFDAVQQFVSRPAGKFTKSISTRSSFFGASEFIDLIHRIQLDITQADISFTAPLSFDAEIREGDVYVGDMFKLYRYENLLYTMQLTGREIKDFLEYSYSLWTNQMKTSADDILLFREAGNSRNGLLKNPYYNFDAAAGIKYTVDVTKSSGEKINIISMYNGDKFDLDKTYKVAINSYRGNGGGGHLTEGAKIAKDELNRRIIFSTSKDLRYYLMQWIERQKQVEPSLLSGNDEWKFVPETLVKPAIERNYKLLFSNKK
ncbi:MAG: 5'-nucleotidase C-terminal domain-containing protein [Prevotellaceae bacterium]|jgi:2',3'-cyclic-nucleotide 2'-phosphodiesterase/3'-nucleotidase|nr:5'-nucleotidase C-terminal domain-containing protein [Prevotellaceae bacterium]